MGQEKKLFELKGHSVSLGDTGDFDGFYEITNGKVSIFTKDDDDDGLQVVVDALNKSECEFYLDDSNTFLMYEFEKRANKLSKLLSDLIGLIPDEASEPIKKIIEEAKYNL